MMEYFNFFRYNKKKDKENLDKKNQIIILDLSLLPFELLETITGLIGRLILEFTQRINKVKEYKDKRGEYPIALILEEAQNYIPEVDKNGKKIRKQLEVDFVCNKGSKRFYIQSAYALPDKEKMEQEQRSLVNTGDGFKKIIITKDAVAPLYNEEGILVMSVYDFLLNPDSMEI